MSIHKLIPLVSSVYRRGWRDVLTLRPPTRRTHTALVITRGARLITVIPANARLMLSDYFDLPCDLREIDMRERLLTLEMLLDSSDIGYQFVVTLNVTYRVESPQQVALGHENVLSELEQAVVQRARLIGRTLGIEQTSLLRDYIYEALTSGNELPDRFAALGLRLIRTDVAVELGARERSQAAAVREQIKDRPFSYELSVESSDPESSFPVTFGCFYRPNTRDLRRPLSNEEAEAAILRAVERVLHQVAVQWPPHQYRDAARDMTEQLWVNTVIKAELAALGIEMLRPETQITPIMSGNNARQLGVRSAAAPGTDISLSRTTPEPALPNPPVAFAPVEHAPAASVATTPTAVPPLSSFAEDDEDAATTSSDDWQRGWEALTGGLASATPRDQTIERWIVEPDTTAPVVPHRAAPDSPMPHWMVDAAPDVWAQPAAAAPHEPQHDATDTRQTGITQDDNADLWADDEPIITRAPFVEEASAAPTIVAVSAPVQPAIVPAPVDQTSSLRAVINERAAALPASAQDDTSLSERVSRWLQLLYAQGDGYVKLVAVDLMDDPGQLESIIGSLTSDPALLERTGDAAHQRALLGALRGGPRRNDTQRR